MQTKRDFSANQIDLSDLTQAIPYWNERASYYDDDFKNAPVRLEVLERFRKLIDVQDGEIVVDLGTGTGRLFTENFYTYSPKAILIGLDLSLTMLQRAKHNSQLRGLSQTSWGVAEFTNLPLQSESVDHVISSMSLHHIPDDRKFVAINEIKRILKPGGKFVIADQIDCLEAPISEEDFLTEMLRTFYPHISLEEGIVRFSAVREWTSTAKFLIEAFRSQGFTVSFSRISNIVGILYGQLPNPKG